VALAGAGALVLGGVVAIPAAVAQLSPAGPYSIDGTVPDSGLSGITDPSGNSKELGPINSNTTKLGVIHKANPPMLGDTNPNGQVDLNQVWLDTGTKNDQTFLYIGWSRDANKGSGFLMYEFQEAAAPIACAYSTASDAELIAGCNPWANRAVNDFILVWDQQGNSTDIILRKWESDGAGGLKLNAGVNLTGVGYAEARFSTDNSRGEAQINLDASGVFSGNSCKAFANVIPGTVTGNSDTADYKDTVLAKVPPITNCGTVTIEKKTLPTADATTDFTWTLSRSSGKDIKFAGDKNATAKIKHGAANKATVSNLLTGTDYTLVETDPGPAYKLTDITCTLEGKSYDVDGGADFPVSADGVTACVITNTLQPGTLTVKKALDYKYGGTAKVEDFAFSVSGPTTKGNVPFESDGSNDLTVDAGTYNVTETTIPTNYKQKSNTCKDVVVKAGGSASCTITNEDVPATLKVVKVIDNKAGGTKKFEDFAFSVSGPTASSNVSFEADGDNQLNVAKGTYTVTEDASLGYDVKYNNCKDVAIPYAGTATCTITNTYPQNAPTAKTVQSWILLDSFSAQIRPGAPNAGDAKVTFALFSDQQCTTQVGTDEVVKVTVSADGKEVSATTKDGYLVKTPGDYFWTAKYSGDAYNSEATSGCTKEITRIAAQDDVNTFPATP
jgi:hypothetical protein